MNSRQANLDLIRALAIGMVLVHHIGQFLPLLSRQAHQYTGLGAHGVDLFFVLSGWLIGSLYWKERKQYGRVELMRFWARRWLRTIPPYLFVLPVAFGGVYFTRGQEFNIKYLFFLQNYEDVMPFFLVSWSLCVEEHFYLFMPLLVAFLMAIRAPMNLAFSVLLLASFLARFADPAAIPGQPFGYAETASHLNFSGLLIGLWFSYLATHDGRSWILVQAISKRVVIPMALMFFLIPFGSDEARYYLSDSFVAVFFGALLATLTAAKPIGIAKRKTIYFVSITSYSVYLTHGIVLYVCIKVTDVLGVYREAVFPVWLAAIMVVGYLAYAIVERPSIMLRDKLFPRRSAPEQLARPVNV